MGEIADGKFIVIMKNLEDYYQEYAKIDNEIKAKREIWKSKTFDLIRNNLMEIWKSAPSYMYHLDTNRRDKNLQSVTFKLTDRDLQALVRATKNQIVIKGGELIFQQHPLGDIVISMTPSYLSWDKSPESYNDLVHPDKINSDYIFAAVLEFHRINLAVFNGEDPYPKEIDDINEEE